MQRAHCLEQMTPRFAHQLLAACCFTALGQASRRLHCATLRYGWPARFSAHLCQPALDGAQLRRVPLPQPPQLGRMGCAPRLQLRLQLHDAPAQALRLGVPPLRPCPHLSHLAPQVLHCRTQLLCLRQRAAQRPCCLATRGLRLLAALLPGRHCGSGCL